MGIGLGNAGHAMRRCTFTGSGRSGHSNVNRLAGTAFQRISAIFRDSPRARAFAACSRLSATRLWFLGHWGLLMFSRLHCGGRYRGHGRPKAICVPAYGDRRPPYRMDLSACDQPLQTRRTLQVFLTPIPIRIHGRFASMSRQRIRKEFGRKNCLGNARVHFHGPATGASRDSGQACVTHLATNRLEGLRPLFPINSFLAAHGAFACTQVKFRRFQLFPTTRLHRNFPSQIMQENMRQGLLTERAPVIN